MDRSTGGQWLDDDRFVAVSDATPGDRMDFRYDLSTCSVSDGTCTEATTLDGSQGEPVFPTGKITDSWW